MAANVQDRLKSGIAAHQSGDIKAAYEAYRDVLDTDPNQPDAIHFLGLLFVEHGKHEEAIALIRKSLSIQPDNAAAHSNLGNVLNMSDRKDEALAAYAEAIRIDPDHQDAWHNIRVVLRASGATDDRLAVVRQAVEASAMRGQARCNLALSLFLLGDKEAAADTFQACTSDDPDGLAQPVLVARMLHELGRREKAVAFLERLVERQPGNQRARYQLALCRGEAVDKAPDGYVVEAFDALSETFDGSLRRLDYRAPELVGDAVRRLAGERGDFADAVDLGCGTGLCGVLIRDCCRRLTGVDLSPGMLRKAAERGGYDELVEAELVAFLNAGRPRRFDLAVSADTLNYLGDLGPFMQALSRALQPGGTMIGTVERSGDDDGATAFRVGTSGRFTHGTGYLRQTAGLAGLEFASEVEVVLRQEMKEDVRGTLFQLRKPDTGPAGASPAGP